MSTATHPESGAAYVEVWRRQILERAAWLVWAAVTVAVVVLLREAIVTHSWSMFVVTTASWVTVGLAACLRRADMRLRGAGLYAGIAIACTGAVVAGAFRVPNAFLALMMVSVVLAVSLGRRAAILSLLTSTAGLVVLAALYSRSMIELQARDVSELREPIHWIRVIAIFAALTAATLACVTFLTSKLEHALKRGQSLLDALASESQQRLEALERERALFAQLQQAQKLEAVGTLAGGVAHDFNNLLLVILGHIELMRSRAQREPGQAEASLRAIEDSARRAASLTRQLLAFSRQQISERHVLDLDASVDRSLAMFGRLLPASIELRVEHGHEPLPVRGTQVELDQILMNLCVNARDAMPSGGTLRVTTSLQERGSGGAAPLPYACISVRDDGTGMDEPEQQRIFDPFYTTKGPDRGTGLGLSVVHGIVTQWGGFIEVSSELGRGTEMRVFLPREDAAARASAEEHALTASLRGRERILLAEDEPRVRAITTAILADAGYDVTACADGEEALRRFRHEPYGFDLLVTDAVMPRMGGLELCEAIALERPELPVLVCTGYADAELESRLLGAPRRELLHKPFSSVELLSHARSLLDAAAAPLRDSSEPSAPLVEVL